MNKMNNQEIGKRLALIRRSNNYTQEQLAEYLDLTSKHISHCESGTSSISLKSLINFCELFNCSLDYVIFGKSNDHNIEKLNPDILEIIRTGSDKDLYLLNKYLDLFCEIRKNQEK